MTSAMKRVALASAATLSLVGLGGSAMAASTQHSANSQASRTASIQANPPTIQQALALVGIFMGTNAEGVAQAYLQANGYPTTGVITPALAQRISSGLASLAKNAEPTANAQSVSSGQDSNSGAGSGSGSYTPTGRVLPANFPNPANLNPVAEPSLSSPSQGEQGQFTPSVSSIDGRPVLKAFHMVATAYAPSAQDNYPYGPEDYFGQPLRNGMIAVDPSVIPLRSILYVTGYQDNYLPSGGFLGQAMDTGGAIQGDRIDIFINASENAVNDFGVQQVTVYELGN